MHQLASACRSGRSGRSCRGGRNALGHELRRLGVTQKNGRPNYPQTHGKVERLYNTRRPHRALGRTTSAAVFAARHKAGSGGLTAAAHYRLRHDRIDANGTLTIHR